MSEAIARTIMILLGFALAMLGIIYAIHTQDVYLGILIASGGVASMFVGLPSMSDYFWCHGPSCHEKVTTDRVKGTKGSKVLRTRKIKQHYGEYYDGNRAWNYFCSQGLSE